MTILKQQQQLNVVNTDQVCVNASAAFRFDSKRFAMTAKSKHISEPPIQTTAY